MALILGACRSAPDADLPAEIGAAPAMDGVTRMRVGLAVPGAVRTGLDVLYEASFASLRGRRVGLVANHSAIDRRGRHAVDLMRKGGVELVALFTPEHGLRGLLDEKVASGRDPVSGLPIHSLYGKTRRPTADMLRGIDTLVFDIQDIGARFYTYIATLGGCLEEAKRHGVRVVVLDRPNPLGGVLCEGPIQDEDLVGKFTAYYPMPVTHGMTLGEIARLFNEDIGAELEVVRLRRWRRGMLFDATGLPWVNPSPNMRSLDEELLYPMVALTESNKDVSVGRGTDRPFEYVGAPWVDGQALADALNERELPGLWFMAARFVPSRTDVSGRPNPAYPHAGQVCQGVRIVITNRKGLRPVESGLHLLSALLALHPERYRVDGLRGLVGARWVLEGLKEPRPPSELAERWRADPRFQAFLAARKRALLYR